ncbi:hypothetical protein B0F90DRAFT_607720 [Multifurca ochricompacta]|uniref:Uncharacterized protein n=1 Tax=Multifurca ochricompacta TaxID=376703 RepID=A0AAD4LTJ9_9AGAM|nr:hypothetical protein B0F90DRAFT_607720 [Multifurca ochricompacta]
MIGVVCNVSRHSNGMEKWPERKLTLGGTSRRRRDQKAVRQSRRNQCHLSPERLDQMPKPVFLSLNSNATPVDKASESLGFGRCDSGSFEIIGTRQLMAPHNMDLKLGTYHNGLVLTIFFASRFERCFYYIEGQEKVLGWLISAHVSRPWRYIAKTNPLLWRRIIFNIGLC